nr:hypothetical protein [Sicyoidochytrium minutum DNA virus]
MIFSVWFKTRPFFIVVLRHEAGGSEL